MFGMNSRFRGGLAEARSDRAIPPELPSAASAFRERTTG